METKATRSIINTTSDKNKSGWRSYKFYCDDQGKEVTDDLVRTNAVDFKRIPKLVAESLVPYPHDQVIWWDEDTQKKGTATVDTLSQERSSDATDPDVRASFDETFQLASEMTRNAGPRPSAPCGEPEEASDPLMATASTEAIDTCVKNIARWHGELDRKKREVNALLCRSGDCTFSKGTPVEAAIKRLMADTLTTDGLMLAADTNLRAKQHTTVKVIEDCKAYCITIAANIKQVAKLGTSLEGTIELNLA